MLQTGFSGFLDAIEFLFFTCIRPAQPFHVPVNQRNAASTVDIIIPELSRLDSKQRHPRRPPYHSTTLTPTERRLTYRLAMTTISPIPVFHDKRDTGAVCTSLPVHFRRYKVVFVMDV